MGLSPEETQGIIDVAAKAVPALLDWIMQTVAAAKAGDPAALAALEPMHQGYTDAVASALAREAAARGADDIEIAAIVAAATPPVKRPEFLPTGNSDLDAAIRAAPYTPTIVAASVPRNDEPTVPTRPTTEAAGHAAPAVVAAGDANSATLPTLKPIDDLK